MSIYCSDTFDENTPPVDDPDYISSLGATIFKGMQSADSDAVWLMQGWLFTYDPFWRPTQMKALLHSVPLGKLIVLDLYAEVKPIWATSKQFYGIPYIWKLAVIHIRLEISSGLIHSRDEIPCMLHNFAGNVEMYGVLDAVGSGPVEARTSENSTMVGVGMSMEGIEQNPVVYDLMSEMAFQHSPVDVKFKQMYVKNCVSYKKVSKVLCFHGQDSSSLQDFAMLTNSIAWIDLYSRRRYGRFVQPMQDAWNILYHTIYNCTDGAYVGSFKYAPLEVYTLHHLGTKNIWRSERLGRYMCGIGFKTDYSGQMCKEHLGWCKLLSGEKEKKMQKNLLSFMLSSNTKGLQLVVLDGDKYSLIVPLCMLVQYWQVDMYSASFQDLNSNKSSAVKKFEITSLENFFMLNISFVILVKDKNRDVIVSFPDVDPNSISTLQTVLNDVHERYGKRYLRRAILEEPNDSYDKPHLWYSTSEVIHALKLFLESGNQLSDIRTFRLDTYDLIDLTRQVLAKYANELFLDAIEAYKLDDLHAVAHLSQKFLGLVEDLDMLLGCHDGFLLGPWIESAKELAQDEDQERQFEWNARTQITMWFDNTELEASLLRDYGNKYWSGLLRDYYGPRAAIYFKYLIESLEEGKGFNLKAWRREWIKLTNSWQSSRNVFPIKSRGNALNVSQWLFQKYLQDLGSHDH
uniref:Alpha-N-acetylglucosaminidase C-terminal domain-containing protein n=1 Tax=Solanum lycopersicum TaxID=4081 RepID=A0A3Q7GFN7_SOLLC